jgi:Uncharacterized protein conserved in bacteria
MWNELLTALALVLVIEGITPFINPAGFRRMIYLVSRMDDTSLRIIGLTSMTIGILLLYLIH